ncbi:Eukaryotic peptide chain release factor GTP-binding subunit [Podila humilis]|nr:Eukaryotic peptide chain release factor GTP-binding subunit [Podila humilis]
MNHLNPSAVFEPESDTRLHNASLAGAFGATQPCPASQLSLMDALAQDPETSAGLNPSRPSHSSEMLPLQEFLARSQNAPGEQGSPAGYSSFNDVDMGTDMGMDVGGERQEPEPVCSPDFGPPSYRLQDEEHRQEHAPQQQRFSRRYSPPPTPPPPAQMLSNQIGRVPITSATGEFTGFQHYASPAKEALALQEEHELHGGNIQMPDLSLPAAALAPSISQGAARMTLSDSGMTGHGHDHDHDEDEFLHQGRPIRNYKIFPGRNMFFCGGRIMTSRDFPAFLVAMLMILIPTGLFHGFTSPDLWHRLSPAAPVVQAYVFIVVFSSMLKTSWTDPGVIPRGIDSDPPLDPPLELDMNSASFYPPTGLPRLKEVQVGIYTVRLKYCDTCKIYRPPRCSHCRQCDNCVEDEDHHCIWLNNCIGRRNYRYFLIFVSTAAVYAFLTAALSLTHLLLLYNDHKRSTSGGPGEVSFTNDAMAEAPVSALLMVYATVMGLAVGSLASYHFWLATKNRTTHEQV